jgi:hypothetical protein
VGLGLGLGIPARQAIRLDLDRPKWIRAERDMVNKGTTSPYLGDGREEWDGVVVVVGWI